MANHTFLRTALADRRLRRERNAPKMSDTPHLLAFMMPIVDNMKSYY
jgi:hypothetical protein